MKRYLPFIIIVLVAAAAATAGALIYRAKHTRVLAIAARTAADDAGGKPGASPAHTHGPDDAPVTIEEYADFQCPPCGMVAALVYNLEQDFPGKLRLIFRQYPLDVHKNARLAALAAEAAGLQGKFWDMHKQLFMKQSVWAKSEDFRAVLDGYAKEIGLDMARFAKDLQSEQTETRLKLDRERATSLEVNATPTLFINGKVVPQESRTPEGIRAEIQKAIDAKKTS